MSRKGEKVVSNRLERILREMHERFDPEVFKEYLIKLDYHSGLEEVGYYKFKAVMDEVDRLGRIPTSTTYQKRKVYKP